MKSLEFIYQDTQIHFLLQTEGEVMINATEMGKVFGKKAYHFLENDTTKNYIKAFIELENQELKTRNSVFISDEDIVFTRPKSGTFMRRELAIYFAMWLDPYFAVWVTKKIDYILWGNLKEYRDAMLEEVEFKNEKEKAREELIQYPTKENVTRYFLAEAGIKAAKNKKNKASTGQMSLFAEQLNI